MSPGSSRATVILLHEVQCQAGIRCPHQSCREMHQSWMFAHPLVVGLAVHLRSELDVPLCSRGSTASMAFLAMELPPVFGVLLTARNHCMERRGSMTTPVRWLRPMELVWSLTATRRPGLRGRVSDALAGGVAVEAVVGRAGKSDMSGLIEDRKAGQVVALADGEVVRVVGWRDLHGAGAELGLGPVVGENGDFAVRPAVDAGEWDADFLP